MGSSSLKIPSLIFISSETSTSLIKPSSAEGVLEPNIFFSSSQIFTPNS
jgi:hypothetical protein